MANHRLSEENAMNESIRPSGSPPGLEKEEPELTYEEDIPSDGPDPSVEHTVIGPEHGQKGTPNQERE